MKNILKIILLTSSMIGVAVDEVQSQQEHTTHIEVQQKLLDAAKNCEKDSFLKTLSQLQLSELSDGDTVRLISYAAECLEEDFFQALIKQKIDIDTYWLQMTALHLVDTPKAVERLVNAGADINSQDDNRATPLMAAVRSCRPQVVEKLLELKADTTIKTFYGKTASEIESLCNSLQDQAFMDRVMSELKNVQKRQETQD